MYYFLFSQVLIEHSSLPFYYYPGIRFISLKHETIPLASFSTNSSMSFFGLNISVTTVSGFQFGCLVILGCLMSTFFFQKSFFVIPWRTIPNYHFNFNSLLECFCYMIMGTEISNHQESGNVVRSSADSGMF